MTPFTCEVKMSNFTSYLGGLILIFNTFSFSIFDMFCGILQIIESRRNLYTANVILIVLYLTHFKSGLWINATQNERLWIGKPPRASIIGLTYSNALFIFISPRVVGKQAITHFLVYKSGTLKNSSVYLTDLRRPPYFSSSVVSKVPNIAGLRVSTQLIMYVWGAGHFRAFRYFSALA